MNHKIKSLLTGVPCPNHLLPFFWQHGEDEATLRKYMSVIQRAGCGAVCVESRPHPDFCGPKWWSDMDVILDEARHREMKVWILDDSHFPTGFANGALVGKGTEHRRESVFCNETTLDGAARVITLDVNALCVPPALPLSQLAAVVSQMSPPAVHFDGDERLLSVTAVGNNKLLDLTANVQDGTLHWQKPAGKWTVCVCGLSHNCGPHRDYINMLDTASCKILIDTVYEPHWQHYKKDFGKTIAGFFSDEPELGNGILYMQHNPIGTPQDLPWSSTVAEELTQRLGQNWKVKLPMLWHTEPGTNRAAQFRYLYMDVVSRTVQKCFSEQIGNWCRTHGVQYIGHIIEDEGQHCRTASSLGHYFRGLSGQDMAGIDDIGGQVMPGGEDEPSEGPMGRTRGGEFYHYGLASLAASAAAIEPRKKGRAMCEIFGNYGWKEGVRLEKYLADHFLVRGINYFVPHAFSPKAYPDPDCPPHFYAQGHNPQYRHFGKLMRYMNRVANLTTGGHRVTTAAVLYHGESEWAGQAMPFEKPLRKLYDRQIACDVLPSDVFAEPLKFHTELGSALRVGSQEYRILVIPECQFLTAATAKAAAQLHQAGMPVLFVNRLPEGICDGDGALLQALASCPVVPLETLSAAPEVNCAQELSLAPANNRIRILHYENESPMYMLVNESTKIYRGTLTLPEHSPCFAYDAMENAVRPVLFTAEKDCTEVSVALPPLQSLLLVFDAAPAPLAPAPAPQGEPELLQRWQRSQCASIEYPHFVNTQAVTLPDKLAEKQPEFSGFVHYETTFHASAEEHIVLEITDAAEGVEVFVNGQSLGMQLISPMDYDLSASLQNGENALTVEVATTLERERFAAAGSNPFERAMLSEPTEGSGLTGTVTLYRS